MVVAGTGQSKPDQVRFTKYGLWFSVSPRLYRCPMDTVFAIAWGIFFLVLIAGWLSGASGGGGGGDFDTKDPGDDFY